MLVGIDASRANKSEKTGTEWYSYHLIQEFKKITGQKDQFILYSPNIPPHEAGMRRDKEIRERAVVSELISKEDSEGGYSFGRRAEYNSPPDETKIILYSREKLRGGLENLPGNWQSRVLGWKPKKLWTQIRLSWEIRRRPPEILFVPAHTLPFSHSEKTVTTCHDIAFMRLPNVYDWPALKYHEFAIRFALKHAAKIITVSEFTKSELVDCFKISPERIAVVPNGYDNSRYKMIENKEAVAKILEKYKISQPYILYTGRLELKKNTPGLIEAFKILKNNPRLSDLKLVLVGQPGFGFERVAKAIVDNNLHGEIIMPGWVEREDMPYLMNGASAFIFPSFYEGFGIPVLEAMACGTPVVCSGIPALREVAREAAYFVDPYDPKNIAEGIERVLSDEHLQEDLKIRGLAGVQDFSWERCARETWKVLESLK